MHKMKVFYNRTQLARALEMAPETLRSRLGAGLIRADAKLVSGLDLFSSAQIERYLATNRAALKAGEKMPRRKQ